MLNYNHSAWYWVADDGRIYSSSCQHLIAEDDADYVNFIAAGGTPTTWPRDRAGDQTVTSMLAVVAPYGLIVASSALDACRQIRLSAITSACGAAIVGGFTSDALGSLHIYPSQQIDQINLMGSVTDSLLPDLSPDWSTPFWCQDENGAWAFRQHDALQIQRVGSDGKAHVVACQTKLAMLTAEANSKTNPEEIAAIGWGAS
ncbi:hypothetical protein [Rhizobium sp. FY34]|uniref:DUF4376 domain-containing protein n=1 Tax=Rhizobium sp. FY34 TaxID=2562309 RepID=UPI0010C14120|nr:hypothetical protein [Rhizobium sp. FY34]